MTVPCSGCIGCRIERVRWWGARMVHESHEHDENCFITPPYDPESLPYGGTLVKKHLQDFWKRLRKSIAPKKIKYYACGEYGDKLSRPHYHACIFNHEFPDRELFAVTDAGNLYTSGTLEKLWPHGFSTIANFSWETASYTAGYAMKKITGSMAEKHYLRLVEDTGEIITLTPEVGTQSNGLGKTFLEKYQSDFARDELPVPGPGNQKLYHKIPRYYLDLLEKTDAEIKNSITEKRLEFLHTQKHDMTPQRLEDRYHVKKAQLSQNRRSYESDLPPLRRKIGGKL